MLGGSILISFPIVGIGMNHFSNFWGVTQTSDEDIIIQEIISEVGNALYGAVNPSPSLLKSIFC